MLVHLTCDASVQRDEDEWGNERREYRVRSKEREIDRSDNSLPRKPAGPEPEIICSDGVMGYVADEKQRGDSAREKHRKSMLGDLLLHDEVEAGYDRDRSRRVQGGVEVRKNAEQTLHRLL